MHHSRPWVSCVSDYKIFDGGNLMNNNLLAAVSILVCFGLFSASGVSAAEKNPCTEDIATYCKDIKPGATSMMDCLERNESRLSPACKDHEAKMGGKKMEMRESMRDRIRFRQNCAPDVAKFCKNIEPGKGAIAKCLSKHKSEVSAPCGESMKEISEIRDQPAAK
jgi:hypothetical protein